MDDGRKIAFVLNHLLTSKPIVVSWCQGYLNAIEDKESTVPNFHKDTFEEFSKKLQYAFLPNRYDKCRALHELYELKQGDSTVEDHVLAFKELVRQAEMEPKSESHWNLIKIFLTSLHPNLTVHIQVRSSINNTRERIEDYYDQALELEARRWANGEEHLLYKDPSECGYDTYSGNLTEEDKQVLMKQGDCFSCREHGHIARNCPNSL